jgi:hypothetical protein
MNLPKTRNEAQKDDIVAYFTGKPCKNGHIDKRYTNTGICYACKRQQANRDYRHHTDRVITTNDRSRKKNINRRRANQRDWVNRNRDKSNKIKKEWKVRHREQYLKGARDYQARKMAIPYFRLSKRFSKAVWAFLKGGKGGRRWEGLVEFTLVELCQHLESQFVGGMSWANYGSYWHVDHIVPKVLFDQLDCKPEDKLKIAFSLVNLRPCVKSGPNGNLSKGAKMIPDLVAPVLEALGEKIYLLCDQE